MTTEQIDAMTMALKKALIDRTNGCFVDAKRKKPRLSVGQLSSNPAGRLGSSGDLRPATRRQAPRSGDGGLARFADPWKPTH